MYVGNRLICCQETDRRFIARPCCDFRVPRSGCVLSVDHCSDTELQFCTPTPRDLPNMGERETGKADEGPTATSSSASPHPSPMASSTSVTLPQQVTVKRNTGMVQMPTTAVVPVGVDASNSLTPTNKPVVPQGWTASWRQMIWEKWRWGVLIALAVIVSRLSASS